MFDPVHEPAVIGMPSAHTGWGAINPADYFLSAMARAVGEVAAVVRGIGVVRAPYATDSADCG